MFSAIYSVITHYTTARVHGWARESALIWASRTSRMSSYFTTFDSVLNLAASLFSTYQEALWMLWQVVHSVLFIIVTIHSRESSVAAVKPNENYWSLYRYCAVEIPPSLRITDVVWGALDKYFLTLQLMLYSVIPLASLNHAR